MAPLLTERVSNVPSEDHGAARKVNVAVPLTVNDGVVTSPRFLLEPNFAHRSAPKRELELQPPLSGENVP